MVLLVRRFSVELRWCVGLDIDLAPVADKDGVHGEARRGRDV